MGQLPKERVNPSFANEMVSVDYAGPVFMPDPNEDQFIKRRTLLYLSACKPNPAI
jgi:hypothetical protein